MELRTIGENTLAHPVQGPISGLTRTGMSNAGRHEIVLTASRAPSQLMQLLARMHESVTDSKCQFGMAFVPRRALDVHFVTSREQQADVHFVQAALVVMLTGRLHYDPAGCYSAKTFVKFSHMRGDCFLDLRRSLHTLKLDFWRSFHFRLLSDNCAQI